ncbi:MAG: phosphoribosylamine--glycine ligase [Bacteroidetes bacterium]|nr:phosphoribosylamine--glycine ligase [Bacteroidota bacterium]
MNVLIIGSGGREHAIAKAIRKSKKVTRVFVSPGNAGIEQVAKCVDIDFNSIYDVVEFLRINNIHFVIIGPEQYIANGLADELRLWHYVVFAPSQISAKLESSKIFAKQFMKENNIPTANYINFKNKELNKAVEYINNINGKIVLKVDGLAAGKGVIVTDDKDYAVQSLKDIFGGKFGSAGNNVVIEEFLEGEEASVLAICDGKNFVCLPPAQDYKRIGDNDTGPNTGGMGAYCPVSIVTSEVLDKIKNKIIIPTLEGMNASGHPYIGCLYVGLMIKDGEPKVVEYNCRFGDPETQAILSIFEGDLFELLHTAAVGEINFSAYNEKATMKKTACCVIVASKGYPEAFDTGYTINGLCDINTNDIIIYHSGTKNNMVDILTAGGRVLGVTGISKNIKFAAEKAYNNVSKIQFENIYYRTDIAQKEIKRLSNL